MSNSRSAFSVPLYGTLQALIVLGYALRPSWYRPLVFIPIVIISFYLIFYTTAGVTADVGIGSGIAVQLLYAFDGIILTNVQKTLYRIGERPGQITSAPFPKRLAWSWHLHNSPRGVRWAHELSHIPQNPPSLNTPESRWTFVFYRFLTLCVCVCTQSAFMVVNAANPALVPGAVPLVHQTLYIRALSVFGVGFPGLAQINTIHCILSIVLVATRISEPADWPPLFGSLAGMYNVQNFWGNVWHQMIRRPILAMAKFILHTLLRLPRPSTSKSSLPIGLLKLHIAFSISALAHLCGEYMMLGHIGFGAFYLFVLQPWAITFEIAVRYLFTGSTHSTSMTTGKEEKPPMIWKLLGYIWVISWFIAVGPIMVQPMIDAGVFVAAGFEESEVTRMVGRWLALNVI